MFCQFCGKEIAESADVCIGCGKLLKNGKKVTPSGKGHTVLSILILVFSSLFSILGMMAFFMGLASDFFTVFVYGNFSSQVTVYTHSFITLMVALIIEACLAIMSLMLLIITNKKALNIVSWSISMGTIVLVGLLVGIFGM